MCSIREADLGDFWYVLFLSSQTWLQHKCTPAWRRGDEASLPTPGNGPHYRTMPYCLKIGRFWCRYCGAIATEEVTSLALSADVIPYIIERPKHNPAWDEYAIE